MSAITRLLIATASRIVPSRFRDDWRAEWQAEIATREQRIAQWPGIAPAGRARLWRAALGAFADALWLQSSHWHSLRLLVRHWRLSLAAIIALGASTAALVIGLSVTNALLFRPPGVLEPDRLLTIYVGPSSHPYGATSFPEFGDYRAGIRPSRMSRRFRSRFPTSSLMRGPDHAGPGARAALS